MKKSKIVSLVLITAALASCHKEDKRKDWENGNKKVYKRSDSTAEYSHVNMFNNGLLWYYAFRPYGYYDGTRGNYTRVGYYNGGISESSNIGRSPVKSGAIRGGFGGHAFSVGS